MSPGRTESFQSTLTMPPRPLHPAHSSVPPGAAREPARFVPNAARQYKVLQSSRAPAQLTLFARPAPLRQG